MTASTKVAVAVAVASGEVPGKPSILRAVLWLWQVCPCHRPHPRLPLTRSHSGNPCATLPMAGCWRIDITIVVVEPGPGPPY